MARKYQSGPHASVRQGGFYCATCGHPLRNAQYCGEMVYAFDERGKEKMASVYMRCRRKHLNAASMDVSGDDTLGFYNRVEAVDSVPKRATKILTAPITAEEIQTS